jgi:hypothetical protein
VVFIIHFFFKEGTQIMSKKISLAVTTILFSIFLATMAYGQQMVCWQLDSNLSGIGPILYKVSFQDLGDGNYVLVGSSYTTTVTYPPKTIRRVLTGGAVVMDEDNLEVSLRTSDISDRPSTPTKESLATSTAHFLLDSTLNGTFHIVGIHYPDTSDTENNSVTTSSFSGTVTLVTCE